MRSVKSVFELCKWSFSCLYSFDLKMDVLSGENILPLVLDGLTLATLDTATDDSFMSTEPLACDTMLSTLFCVYYTVMRSFFSG